MEFIKLEADSRKETGKGPARTVRRAGRIPAVLYGPKTDPFNLTVEANALEQAIKKCKGSQIFLQLEVDGEGGSVHRVMVKELQRHPVSMNPLHADFYEIPMDRKMQFKVPVVTTGKCRGEEDGGILQIIRHELDIVCLPDKIPENIELDVTDLGIGDSIHVKDIPVEEGVEILADVDFTVATVSSPVAEKAAEEAEEGEGEIEGQAGEEGEAASGAAAE